MARPDPRPARRAVFLDRDGVLNENRADYVRSREEFVARPGGYAAVRRLKEAGFAVVVVTNQSAVGRGLLTSRDLDDVHEFLRDELAGHGTQLDGLYVCPHRPDEGCACRKPSAALIERALTELGLERDGSWMVGDAENDMRAGRAAGLRTILVRSTRDPGVGLELADAVVADLAGAAAVILTRAPALAAGGAHEVA